MKLCSAIVLLLLLATLGCGSNPPTTPTADFRLHIYNSTPAAITLEYRADPDGTVTESSGLQRKHLNTGEAFALRVTAVRHIEFKVREPAAAMRISRTLKPMPWRSKELVLDIGSQGQFYKCPVKYPNDDVHAPLPPNLANTFPIQKFPGTKGLYELDQPYAGINIPAPQLKFGPLDCAIAMRYILVDAVGLKKREQGLPVGP